MDGNGNIYISGQFWSTNFSIDSITLPSYGDYDIFIAKFDNSGNLLWTKSVGGSEYESAVCTAVDYNGNFYITGNFKSDSLLFDSISLTNTSNYYNVFVVKYDSSANAVWAKKSIGYGYDVSYDICLDNNQNVAITGTFEGSTITFDSLTLSNSGTGSIFIVKYDNYGNLLWAKSAIGSGAGAGIATDINNNILVIGEFTNPSITFDSITLTSNGGSDTFIIKLDNSGNIIWAKKAGGNDDDFGVSIAVDSYSNTYVTGSFISPILMLDTLVLNNSTIGFPDLFVAKYDQFGNITWVIGAVSSNLTMCKSIALDGNNDIYISGEFGGSTLTFGSTTLTNTTPFSSDIFVAKISNISNGIQENPQVNTLSIIPNPFSYQSILYTNISLNNAIITFSNILGQEVLHLSNIQGESAILYRNNLPCGIYLVRITQDNQIKATKKVIITD